MMTERNYFTSGQVALLVILLGILGLTVGLSVVSRSLSDLRQASFVDFGTKALAAAEAGAQYGLNQINTSGAGAVNCGTPGSITNGNGPNISFSGIGATGDVTYEVCPDVSGFAQETESQDDVMQVDLPTVISGSTYPVFWKNTAQAAEVAALYKDGSGNYSVKRYAYNTNGTSGISGDNFASGALPASCAVSPNCTPLVGSYNSCTSSVASTVGSSNLVQIRVKPLGGGSDILVCNSTAALPSQYYTVVGTATTTNGTKKKVQVTRSINGVLPAVFDNVIFSGGSLTK